MSQTIETIFAAICAENDLTSISIAFSTDVSPRYAWGSYAHWSSKTVCASGHGATPQEALRAAINAAAKKRAVAVDVPAITLDLVA